MAAINSIKCFLIEVSVLPLFAVLWVGTHCGETLLIPQWTDDEGDESAFHEPAQGQLGAEGEEVTHLVQVKWTLARHRDERWTGHTA